MISSIGEINIDINSSLKDENVSVLADRPVTLSKTFIGKSIEDVLDIIPLIYNVCGIAHSKAGLLATESSLGLSFNPKMEMAREIILLSENLRENLLRVLLDWPIMFGSNINQNSLQLVSKLSATIRDALFFNGKAFNLNSQLEINREQLETSVSNIRQCIEEHIFGLSLTEWNRIVDFDEVLSWSGSSNQIAATSVKYIIDNDWSNACVSDSQKLPNFVHQLLINKLTSTGADKFIYKPDWEGVQYETTSFSKNINNPLIKQLNEKFGNGLLTRWVARLTEIERLVLSIEKLIFELFSNQNNYQFDNNSSNGLAIVDAARGRLVHYLELKGRIVKDYKILAPTEWNFHPKGVVYQSLITLLNSVHKNKRQLIEMFISTVDPCVSYNLRIN